MVTPLTTRGDLYIGQNRNRDRGSYLFLNLPPPSLLKVLSDIKSLLASLKIKVCNIGISVKSNLSAGAGLNGNRGVFEKKSRSLIHLRRALIEKYIENRKNLIPYSQ